MWDNIKSFLDSLKNPVTIDQYMGLIRQAIPFIGGVLVAFGASADWVSGAGTDILLIAGPAMTLVGVIWSMVANNKTSIIKAAAKMPETERDGRALIIIDPALAQAAVIASKGAGKPNA